MNPSPATLSEDAKIVDRVRKWLNHGAEREQSVETKDLRRICHLAHLHVQGTARSETPQKPDFYCKLTRYPGSGCGTQCNECRDNKLTEASQIGQGHHKSEDAARETKAAEGLRESGNLEVANPSSAPINAAPQAFAEHVGEVARVETCLPPVPAGAAPSRQDLKKWGQALKDENHSLGQRLLDYADSWEIDLAEMAFKSTQLELANTKELLRHCEIAKTLADNQAMGMTQARDNAADEHRKELLALRYEIESISSTTPQKPPSEATDRMCVAGASLIRWCIENDIIDEHDLAAAADIWRAMFNAAPQAATGTVPPESSAPEVAAPASVASAIVPNDSARLDWVLNNIDPVELDAVLGERLIRSVNEARVLIDGKMNSSDGGAKP